MQREHVGRRTRSAHLKKPTESTHSTSPGPLVHHVIEPPEASLLDVLDRLLDKGVAANGEVMLGVAGVDLIYLRLTALLCAADRVLPRDPLSPERQSRKSRHRQPGARRLR